MTFSLQDLVLLLVLVVDVLVVVLAKMELVSPPEIVLERELKPMVFSGIYPINPADYEHLKANLAKLAEKAKNVPGLKRTGGFIGLQNHSSPVFYRNIRIKELK